MSTARISSTRVRRFDSGRTQAFRTGTGAKIRRHLLSFVADPKARHIAIHVDRRGIDALIGELEQIREMLDLNECCDAQLFGYSTTDSLTNPPVASQNAGAKPINHVKIYGWTEKWLNDQAW